MLNVKTCQHESCQKIIKKWGLKKIRTKNLLVDWRKLKCQEKVIQNFSGLTMKFNELPMPNAFATFLILPSSDK